MCEASGFVHNNHAITSMQDASLARIEETDQALFFTSTTNTPSESSAVVTAQLSGTFLRGPGPGIVCYRRNFFHVRGTVIFQSDIKSALSTFPGGESRHICIQASLTAVESLNGDQVAIIAHRKGSQDASSSNGTQTVAPVNITIEPSSDLTTAVSFSWSRLQFRAATAKGGRRKEKAPEQSFRLQLRVSALIGDAPEILLAEKCSAPIIVRGRSPGNYPSTSKVWKDDASTVASCQNPSQDAPGEQPPLTGESTAQALTLSNVDVAAADGPHLASPSYEDFLDLGNLESLMDLAGAPTDVSATQLGNDERSIGLSPPLDWTNAEYLDWADSSHLFSPTLTPRDCLHSTDPSADLLSTTFPPADFTDTRTDYQHGGLLSDDASEASYSYTYIPLAMDDRTPPVQAVYQPHGAHHKVTLPKTLNGSGKRYFGELTD